MKTNVAEIKIAKALCEQFSLQLFLTKPPKRSIRARFPKRRQYVILTNDVFACEILSFGLCLLPVTAVRSKIG